MTYLFFKKILLYLPISYFSLEIGFSNTMDFFFGKAKRWKSSHNLHPVYVLVPRNTCCIITEHHLNSANTCYRSTINISATFLYALNRISPFTTAAISSASANCQKNRLQRGFGLIYLCKGTKCQVVIHLEIYYLVTAIHAYIAIGAGGCIGRLYQT